MAEFENKRPRRTPEERASEMNCKIDKLNQSILQLEIKKQAAISEYDAKIAAVQERINVLETKKKDILDPKSKRKPRKTKKQKIQEIVRLAIKNGMSVEQVANQLSVEVTE